MWNFEHSSIKNKILKILTLWGPGPPKRGSQTKKFQKIFILVYTIYVVWNFERSSLKNGDFKILAFRGPAGPNGAPKPKNFKRYYFWFTQSMLCEILSALPLKMAILNFWHLGAPRAQTGPPNQNFLKDMIFGLQDLFCVKFWAL